MKQSVFFVAAVLLFTASPVEAQNECPVKVEYGCSPTVDAAHNASEFYNGGWAGEIHGECLYCLLDDPYECHECFDTFALLTDAMNERDFGKLLALAEHSPEYLALNRRRAALQLRSCDRKTVIGSIHLTGEQMAEFGSVIDDATSAVIAGTPELVRAAASQATTPR